MRVTTPTEPAGVSRITAGDLLVPVAEIFRDLETRLAAGIARIASSLHP